MPDIEIRFPMPHISEEEPAFCHNTKRDSVVFYRGRHVLVFHGGSVHN